MGFSSYSDSLKDGDLNKRKKPSLQMSETSWATILIIHKRREQWLDHIMYSERAKGGMETQEGPHVHQLWEKEICTFPWSGLSDLLFTGRRRRLIWVRRDNFTQCFSLLVSLTENTSVYTCSFISVFLYVSVSIRILKAFMSLYVLLSCLWSYNTVMWVNWDQRRDNIQSADHYHK